MSGNNNLETAMTLLAGTMNDLAVSNGQTNLRVKEIAQTVGVVIEEVKDIRGEITTMKADGTKLKEEVEDLKNIQPIYGTWLDNITDHANSKVHYLLNLAEKRDEWTDKMWQDYNAYYKTFIKRIYSDARSVGLARKLRDTKRMYYPAIIEFIDNWVPKDSKFGNGVAGLKAEVDKRRQQKAVAA